MRKASLNRLKKNYCLESFQSRIPINTWLRFTIIHSHPPLRKVLRLCKYWMSLIETEKCGDWLQCSLFERTNVWLPYYQFVRQCALLQEHNRWNTNFSIVNTNKSKCALCVESLHLTHCNPLHLHSIVCMWMVWFCEGKCWAFTTCITLSVVFFSVSSIPLLIANMGIYGLHRSAYQSSLFCVEKPWLILNKLQLSTFSIANRGKKCQIRM